MKINKFKYIKYRLTLRAKLKEENEQLLQITKEEIEREVNRRARKRNG